MIEFSERDAGPGIIELELEGELDTATAPQLAARIAAAISAGITSAVIDLNRLSFIDSSGLSVLIALLKRLRSRGGDLKIVCSQERILRAFRVTGLDQMLAIEPCRRP